MKQNDPQPTLDVIVQNLNGETWEGKATSVSAKNLEGNFDILPYHANFMSILLEGPLVIRTETGEEKTLNLSESVIHLKDNLIRIYSSF